MPADNDPTLAWHVCLAAHDLCALRLDAGNHLVFLRFVAHMAGHDLDIRVIRCRAGGPGTLSGRIRHVVLVLGGSVPNPATFAKRHGNTGPRNRGRQAPQPDDVAMQVIAGRRDVWYAVQAPGQPLQLAQLYRFDEPFRAHDTVNLVERVRLLNDPNADRTYARAAAGSLHIEIVDDLINGWYLDAR